MDGNDVGPLIFLILRCTKCYPYISSNVLKKFTDGWDGWRIDGMHGRMEVMDGGMDGRDGRMGPGIKSVL